MCQTLPSACLKHIHKQKRKYKVMYCFHGICLFVFRFNNDYQSIPIKSMKRLRLGDWGHKTWGRKGNPKSPSPLLWLTITQTSLPGNCYLLCPVGPSQLLSLACATNFFMKKSGVKSSITMSLPQYHWHLVVYLFIHLSFPLTVPFARLNSSKRSLHMATRARSAGIWQYIEGEWVECAHFRGC